MSFVRLCPTDYGETRSASAGASARQRVVVARLDSLLGFVFGEAGDDVRTKLDKIIQELRVYFVTQINAEDEIHR